MQGTANRHINGHRCQLTSITSRPANPALRSIPKHIHTCPPRPRHSICQPQCQRRSLLWPIIPAPHRIVGRCIGVAGLVIHKPAPGKTSPHRVLRCPQTLKLIGKTLGGPVPPQQDVALILHPIKHAPPAGQCAIQGKNIMLGRQPVHRIVAPAIPKTLHRRNAVSGVVIAKVQPLPHDRIALKQTVSRLGICRQLADLHHRPAVGANPLKQIVDIILPHNQAWVASRTHPVGAQIQTQSRRLAKVAAPNENVRRACSPTRTAHPSASPTIHPRKVRISDPR